MGYILCQKKFVMLQKKIVKKIYTLSKQNCYGDIYMWGVRGTVEETNEICEGISANGAYHQNQRDLALCC